MPQKLAKVSSNPRRKPIRASEKPQHAVGTQARAIQTRQAILDAAVKVFSTSGYDGGRIDTISRLAHTHDRLIYYYFGSKDNLFVEVLKSVYKRMNDAEASLQIDAERPRVALVQIVDFMWRYYLGHPEFVTLLNTENLHEGKHLRRAQRMHDLVSPAIAMLEQVLARGVEEGLFRRDVSGRDLYVAIASLGYFYVSNRYTLSAFLDERLMTAAALAHWREFIADAVLRMAAPAPASAADTTSISSTHRPAS